jgi:transcriptional regulator NrdR family protein|tara:strand:- start:1252 stop:1563 length:312 start_codon:yes stop_codon:yes gene_type:complete
MNCVKCNSATSVVDSRPLKFCKKTHRDASAIKRRRKCNSCGHRFNTIEQLLTETTVIKTVVVKEKVKEKVKVSKPKVIPRDPFDDPSYLETLSDFELEELIGR